MSNKLKKDDDNKKKKTVKTAKKVVAHNENTVKPQQSATSSDDQKIITNYDKKRMKRQKEAERAKKTKKVTLISTIVVIAVIIAVGAINIYNSFDRIHNQYIAINDEPISQIEFDFYYNTTKQNLMNQTLYGDITYKSYFSSYLGYDASKADNAQKYSSTDHTWYDYFANNAVTTIKENKALLKAAEEKGFDYKDGDSDYQSFCSDISDAASKAGKSISEYYKSTFGSHATESNLKLYVYEFLKANAYQKQIQTELTPTDQQITDYYNENKSSYDTVTYRSFAFTAEDKADSASMEEMKQKANAMAAGVTDESSFASLCQKNATGDDADKYSDESASLSTDATKSSMSTAVAEWMYDDSRTEGQINVIEDTDKGTYTVVYFINRKKPDTADDTIKSTLLNQSYSEFIKGYTDNMKLNNIKNRIKMYTEES